MQHASPPVACDCTRETLRIVAAIHECSTCPPPSDASNNSSSSVSRDNSHNCTVSLGEVLGAGRLLVRNWERLNGCSNGAAHLDAAMLQAMAEATSGLLGLYESVGVSNGIIPGSTALGSTRDNTPALATVEPAAYLGAHALDAEEAVMVGREALRHFILLLGEVLHDISKDVGDLGGDEAGDARALLDRSSAGMLRLLGRINT